MKLIKEIQKIQCLGINIFLKKIAFFLRKQKVIPN
jgi:hypothetical protein